VSWIGFDQPKKLGTNETGSLAALPIWMGYMGRALKGVPEVLPVAPAGVVAAKIDPETGLQSPDGLVAEYFYREFLPAESPTATAGPAPVRSTEEVRSQLF
ncbi:MAG: penicillin-binding protein, partial [Chloroflexi bacterium]|nr:penicillin-binding protein [Chloroflexota bacterium]